MKFIHSFFILITLFISSNPSRAAPQNEGDNKINSGAELSGRGPSESPATNVPLILTNGSDIVAREGDTVILPCVIKDLGELIVVWRRSEGKDVLFARDYKITRDSRIKLVKNTTDISIEGVQQTDAGDYTCSVGTNPPREITHQLTVTAPPHVLTVPEDGLLLVVKGNPINITCVAGGSPMPTIKWRKKDGDVRQGVEVDKASLLILNASRVDAGVYECEASNGVGTPTVQVFRVKVLHEPEITTAHRYVHGAVNSTVELVCEVHAEPTANVTWVRSKDNMPLKQTEKYVPALNETIASLMVRLDSVEDYDNYTCIAKNTFGQSSAPIELFGRPGQIKITSKPVSETEDSYTLTWEVMSHNPMKHYTMRYRQMNLENSDQQGEPKWNEVKIEPSAPENGLYKETYLIKKISRGSYVLQLDAENDNGLSRPSDMFSFVLVGPFVQKVDDGSFSCNLRPSTFTVLCLSLLSSIKLF